MALHWFLFFDFFLFLSIVHNSQNKIKNEWLDRKKWNYIQWKRKKFCSTHTFSQILSSFVKMLSTSYFLVPFAVDTTKKTNLKNLQFKKIELELC